MSDREAFLRAIESRPDDLQPRMLYADWLAEQGDIEEEKRQRHYIAQRFKIVEKQAGDAQVKMTFRMLPPDGIF